MTKTKRTNQYLRMEFKTKKTPRTFKTLFDMFTSNKLSSNIYYDNISRDESWEFRKKIRKNPNKYLSNIVLSAKQSSLIKYHLNIDTCKEHHCNKYYSKCYDCSYNDNIKFGCSCVCKGCYDKTGTCSICMIRNKTNTIKLDCTHIFHKECITKWVTDFRKTTCPYCRTTVNQELFPQVNDIPQVGDIPPTHIRIGYNHDLMSSFREYYSNHLINVITYLNPTHTDL